MTAHSHLVRTVVLLLRLWRSSPLVIADKIEAEVERWLERRTAGPEERQAVLEAARVELARQDERRNQTQPAHAGA